MGPGMQRNPGDGKWIEPGSAGNMQEPSAAKAQCRICLLEEFGSARRYFASKNNAAKRSSMQSKKRKLQDAAWRFLENVLRCFVDFRFQLVHRAVILDQKIVINLVNF